MNIFRKYYPYITGLVVFIIYLFTLAPSVVEIDAGELATVICTLGIAHPTGYPLFSILGYIFTHIPLPVSQIYKANLFAAFNCSAAVVVFIFIIKTILNSPAVFATQPKMAEIKGSRKNKKNDVKASANINIQAFPDDVKMLAGIFGGLILAFNQTFWSQSNAVEVYSLHTFLIMLVILALVKAFMQPTDAAVVWYKDKWIIFSVFLALGFSNHMTTLFILPGVAYFYFLRNKLNKNSIRKIGLMLLVFFPVLIILYSYLPLRASANPIMNWGKTTDWEHIIRHISGKQYQVWLFSSFDSASKQFSKFIDLLFGNFSGNAIEFGEYNIVLVIIIAGIIAAYKYAKRFWGFVVITFLFTVAYAINYDIVDIESYFLLAFIMLAFFSVFGILWLFNILKSTKLPYLIPASVIGLFIVIECVINFKENDLHDVYVFEDYTKELLNSTDPNSVILSYQWDFFVSAAYYFQNVESFRKDVTVIDKELLRRSWYFNQLETNHPGIIKRIQPDVDIFLKALTPFERSENFDSQLLETYYQKILAGLIQTNIDQKSVYIGPELVENEMQNGGFALPAGYTLVPDLFLFKVVKQNSAYVPLKNADINIRLPHRITKYTTQIEQMCSTMLVRRALYELSFSKPARAKMYADIVRKNFPDYSIPEQLSKAIGE